MRRVGEVVHRRRQCRNVGDVVRAGIVPVEQVEELDEWGDLQRSPTLKGRVTRLLPWT